MSVVSLDARSLINGLVEMVPRTYIWPYINQLDAGVEVVNTKRHRETVPYVKGMSE